MVANALLRGHLRNRPELAKVITVGTPFYGYAAQLHRWTEGEKFLNGLGNVHKEEIVEVISSLPGCYEFHYPEEPVFMQHLNDLKNDPSFPITEYPCRDAANRNTVADPYNPVEPDPPLRYPPIGNTGFDRSKLEKGKKVVSDLIAPLPQPDMDKLFNIRGVRTVKDTVNGVTWGLISPPLHDQEPVFDDGLTDGDDTQPAWSTRLATLPGSQVRDVIASDIQHMFLLNHDGILAELKSVLV
jgi:hypothetical protein